MLNEMKTSLPACLPTCQYSRGASRSKLCGVCVFSFKCFSKGRLIASFNVYISNKFMDSVYYDGKEITFHIVNRFAKY